MTQTTARPAAKEKRYAHMASAFFRGASEGSSAADYHQVFKSRGALLVMMAHNAAAKASETLHQGALETALSVSLAVVVGLTLASLIYVAGFYVHEAGHMLYGSLDGVLNHHRNQYAITNWAPITVLGIPIRVPQQTSLVTGTPSIDFVLGGPVFVILISGAACAIAHAKTKRPAVWLIFAGLFLQELAGNVLCGTDHVWRGTLTACVPDALLGQWPTFMGLLLNGGCVLAVYPALRAASPRWLTALAHRIRYSA